MRDFDKVLAFLAAIVFELGLLIGICWSIAVDKAYAAEPEFLAVSDIVMEEEPVCPGSSLICLGLIEPEVDEYYEEECYEYSYSYYESDGFMRDGVRAGVDSVTETWYPERAGRHYRTDEWHMDDEGYYRTAEGYYVVASNDYPEGTVINTSKGEAQVLDDGTYSGNVDFYVGW